jgi:hypothetical protein
MKENEMDEARGPQGTKEKCKQNLILKPGGKRVLRRVGVDARKTSELFLKKPPDGRVWTGFILLRVRSSSAEPSGRAV